MGVSGNQIARRGARTEGGPWGLCKFHSLSTADTLGLMVLCCKELSPFWAGCCRGRNGSCRLVGQEPVQKQVENDRHPGDDH